MMTSFKSTFKLAAALGIISLSAAVGAFAQKGVDTQTQKIKDDNKGVTSRGNDATRSWDWGKGKTKVRDRLDNPYKFNARRDALLEAIADVLRERKIVVDEAASRFNDGLVVTLPYVFAKGAVTTQNQLNRYAVFDGNNEAWTRAQYTLTFEIQAIDGIQSKVSIIAKVEGRGGTGLTTEWITLRSSGVIEDEIMAKLVEAVTGNSPEPVQDTGP